MLNNRQHVIQQEWLWHSNVNHSSIQWLKECYLAIHYADVCVPSQAVTNAKGMDYSVYCDTRKWSVSIWQYKEWLIQYTAVQRTSHSVHWNILMELTFPYTTVQEMDYSVYCSTQIGSFSILQYKELVIQYIGIY